MLNALIPIDISGTAYNAMKYAFEFQKDFNFHVTCINAYKGSKPRGEMKRLKNNFTNEFDFELILGNLYSAFDKYITANKVDIIIMGTNEAKGLINLFKGSNASRIMMQTSIPILIIPEHVKYENISKIVWASDLQPVSNLTSLGLIKEIALELESTVRIAHVKTSNEKSTSDVKIHQSWEDSFFDKDVRHSFKKIRKSSVIKGINYYLDQKDDNNLLVLIRREHGLIDKLFKKSHAEEFAKEPRLPVMIIHE